MRKAEVVWITALRGPLTAREIMEIASELDIPTAGVNSTSVVSECWRSGYLVRRKRWNGEKGPDPYEYAVRELPVPEDTETEHAVESSNGGASA